MIRAEARNTLTQIRTLTRLEAWIRCAKAELASTPGDLLLAEFIRLDGDGDEATASPNDTPTTP